MAAFSNIARALTFGMVGRGPKQAGLSAPNPVATAMTTATKPPTTGTAITPITGPAPPDAQAARSSAMTAAQRAGIRTRKRAAGTTQTLATGLGATATSAPRSLLGF